MYHIKEISVKVSVSLYNYTCFNFMNLRRYFLSFQISAPLNLPIKYMSTFYISQCQHQCDNNTIDACFCADCWLRHCFALRVDACWCSFYRKENEKRKKGKCKREIAYGIRVAYRTLHQRNALSDTHQHHYGAMKYARTHACMRNASETKK